MFIIYRYTNKINGKSYVGLTKNEIMRKTNHKSAKRGCKAFYAAIKKYGFENFEYNVLEENIINLAAAEEKEKYHIRVQRAHYSQWGYNLTHGGNVGHSKRGQDLPQAKLTEEQVREVVNNPCSNSTMAKKLNVHPATIQLIRSGKNWKHIPRDANVKYQNGGPRLTEEDVTDIQTSSLPYTVLAEKYNVTRATISYHRRKVHDRIESSFKGKRHTEEAKQKNRLAHLGSKHTESTKRKISDTLKARRG